MVFGGMGYAAPGNKSERSKWVPIISFTYAKRASLFLTHAKRNLNAAIPNCFYFEMEQRNPETKQRPRPNNTAIVYLGRA